MTMSFDTTKPNMARMYDHWLGGKDNISQVVPAVLYSDLTVTVQARQVFFRKLLLSLPGTSLGTNVSFAGRVLLTLA